MCIPYLAILNFSIPFTMECDVSKLAIGIMLMKNGQLIAFKSKKLTNAKKNLSVYDKEMFTIMHPFDKFRQYLVYGPFIIKSDHNSLNYFLNKINFIKNQ